MRNRLPLLVAMTAGLAPAQEPPALEAVRSYALSYVQSLPDYACLQETKRLETGVRNVSGDKVEEELSFFGGEEHYKVLKVNGKPANGVTHEQLGGAISEGEFGAILKQIFDPHSITAFRPQTSGRIQGRAMTLLPFRVPQQTGYLYVDGELHRSMRVAYEGTVWADAETNAVMKIAMKLVNIPKESRLELTDITLDYKAVDISGREFILPSRFEWNWRKRAAYGAADEGGTNQINFSGCRKFTAESNIDFGK